MNNPVPTGYAVVCDEHGLVFLTGEEYTFQMNRPNSRWRCSSCGEEACWHDEYYEAINFESCKAYVVYHFDKFFVCCIDPKDKLVLAIEMRTGAINHDKEAQIVMARLLARTQQIIVTVEL